MCISDRVYTNRGNPGVEAVVTTENGATGRAMCTSGISIGTHEIHFDFDGGERFRGKGGLGAVRKMWIRDRKKGYINEDVLTLYAAGAQQMLGSGEAAFMVRGTDNITVARQYYPDANMGVLPLPSSADGAPSFRVGEGDAWGVWKDTENEAACWALLDYLARPEVGSKWATVSGALPTVEGADAADVYTLNCYKQAVEDCNGKVQYDNLFDRKFFPSGMWGIMADSMSMMLSNPDDVTEAVEYLRDNYLELYAEQNG